MSGFPFYYDYRNTYNSTVNPSLIHITDTALAQYYHRHLLRKAMSVFKWKMPEHWAENYFKYVLYCYGFVAIINTDKFGVIPQHGTLYGYNVQYQPHNVIISNPLLTTSLDLVIDKNVTVIKLHDDYTGIMDVVYTYGDLMALTVQTLTTNLVNSKLSYIFMCDDKQIAESLKELYDRVGNGDPAVFFDKAYNKKNSSLAKDAKTSELIPPWFSFTQNLSQNFISPALLEVLSEIENEFLSQIGMPSANTDKRERLIKDEIKVGSVQTYSEPEQTLDLLKKGVEKAKRMFQINDFSVKWRYKPEINENGGVQNAGTVISNRTL